MICAMFPQKCFS